MSEQRDFLDRLGFAIERADEAIRLHREARRRWRAAVRHGDLVEADAAVREMDELRQGFDRVTEPYIRMARGLTASAAPAQHTQPQTITGEPQ